MVHEKLRSLAVMLTIFAIVGGITWALVNAQQSAEPTQKPQTPENMPKFMIKEEIRDAAILYIKEQHPEVELLMENFTWTGGRLETNLLGAETYIYQSQNWRVIIRYPMVVYPVYIIDVNYSTGSEIIGIPYALTWQGIMDNGVIVENDYCFAQ